MKNVIFGFRLPEADNKDEIGKIKVSAGKVGANDNIRSAFFIDSVSKTSARLSTQQALHVYVHVRIDSKSLPV